MGAKKKFQKKSFNVRKIRAENDRKSLVGNKHRHIRFFYFGVCGKFLYEGGVLVVVDFNVYNT